MIYQWLVRAIVNEEGPGRPGIKCEGEYLGTTENDARLAFEESIVDSAFNSRIISITKTGMVLVPEDQLGGGGRKEQKGRKERT